MFRTSVLAVLGLLCFANAAVLAQANESVSMREVTHAELDQLFIGPLAAGLPDPDVATPSAQLQSPEERPYMTSKQGVVAKMHHSKRVTRVARIHRRHRAFHSARLHQPSIASKSHIAQANAERGTSTSKTVIANPPVIKTVNHVNRLAATLSPRPIIGIIKDEPDKRIIALQTRLDTVSKRMVDAEQKVKKSSEKIAVLEAANQSLQAENQKLQIENKEIRAKGGRDRNAGIVQSISTWVSNVFTDYSGYLIIGVCIITLLFMGLYYQATRITELQGIAAMRAYLLRDKRKISHEHAPVLHDSIVQLKLTDSHIPAVARSAASSKPKTDPLLAEPPPLDTNGFHANARQRATPDRVYAELRHEALEASQSMERERIDQQSARDQVVALVTEEARATRGGGKRRQHHQNSLLEDTQKTQKPMTSELSHRFEDGKIVDPGIPITTDMIPITVGNHATL